MRPLSASELLSVWERGWAQRPAQRALILLEAASPETDREVLAELPIGQRDDRLLRLREWTFGRQLVSLAICPSCGERLELSFNVDEVRVTPGQEPKGELSVKAADYKVRFRLPNSLDLLVLPEGEGVEGWRLLLQRCMLTAHLNGEACGAEQLPAEIVTAIAAQMAETDPQADVHLALSCPACSHEWEVLFDIVSFFWMEIQAWAYRLMCEVHALASAYGWSEADVLAMAPLRRQLYLDMVGE